MNDIRVQDLEIELAELIKKQSEFLESRSLGGATDSEILEYEVRQEIIEQICEQLSRRRAA